MKVLLVNKFHYIKGGSETYHFGLAELLKKQGCEVIYFAMKDEKNYPCPQEKYFVDHVDFNAPMSKLQTAKTAIKMLYSLEAKRKFSQLLRDEKPDIIHINLFQSQLTGAIVDAAKQHGIPVVYTAHDLKSVCPSYLMLAHGQVCDRCLQGNYMNCFKTACMKDSKAKSLLASIEAYVYKWKKIYRKMDLIITPSAFHKARIEEAGVADCPVVHMTNFLPEDTEYRCYNAGGDYFFFFGRLSQEKGILLLLRAYAQAKVEKPLYIAGTGPEKEQIEELVRQEGLEDRVKLLGFQSGQALKDLINNAMCVLLPSQCNENCPYSVMEAQAAGKPVVVTEYGGMPELVEDGVTGFIVKKQNVADLAAKLELCEQHGPWDTDDIVRRAKAKYSAEQYVADLLKHYEKLIKQR